MHATVLTHILLISQMLPGCACEAQTHVLLCRLYKSCNLARPLTMQDVWVLGQVAGFHSDPILLDTECLSAHQWIDFGDWFIR